MNVANINDIIRSVLTVVEHQIKLQNIQLICEFDSQLPSTFLDINQIKSVISNLVINAADAMLSAGTLQIQTQWLAEHKIIVINVNDSGHGISEENLSKVFEPFFTTKDPGKGTGLGLSVTYGIVKRHNGSINIKSEVGVGTQIEVQIPSNA